jgi:hypothetical protein
MRVTFRRNVSYVTCRGSTWTERTCHRVVGRPSCSLKCVEVFEASMLAFLCGEVWSAEFQHTLWRASGAIQNAIHGRSQPDRRSTHAHRFWRCPAFIFLSPLVIYILCVSWLLSNLPVFSLRRILEDHPCLEILSVFSPGRRLNYILYRPRQFHVCHCSDGDSVRSTIVLTSYSTAYVLVLPAVR